MQTTPVAVKAWYKTCCRCKKPTFEDLLDERGLCDYCREIAAMKVSSRRKEVTSQSAMYRK